MASAAVPDIAVTEPVAIYKLAHRYLVYDVNVVTHLRQKHNICGVLIGSLAQAAQQNVFLGLPLELMPEETRLLVDQGVAHVVDDVAAHKRDFMGQGMSAEERKAYQAALRKQGQVAATDAMKRSEDRKKAAFKKMGTENWNDIPDDMFNASSRRNKKRAEPKEAPKPSTSSEAAEDDLLFGGSPATGPPKASRPRVYADSSPAEPEPYGVTPTTSNPPLPPPKVDGNIGSSGVEVTKGYPVFKHLHDQGYFLAPGLRFGCQYMAYPGDPLRFHSHFLCNGLDWDEEFDLLDIVGGGRLGTGVKKGFLIGGPEPSTKEDEGDRTRLLTIEWAGI